MSRSIFSLSRICIGLVVLLCVPSLTIAQTGQREPHTLLQKYFGFTRADLNAMEKGQVVTKLPKTANQREVATFGIVRVNAPQEVLVTKVRDIVNFKKSDNVLQIGKFSQPPRLEDLRGLTIDNEDLDALKFCKIGDCIIKLPAETITRLRKEVNWSASNYREQSDRLIRQMLIEYVGEYLKGGNAALSEYHDKPYPLRLADEFRSLLQQSTYIYEYAPEFYRYLEQFPQISLAGAEDFIYWSKEKFGLKPVISLTHVTIYRRNSGGASSVLIASKQIYANHYFESSLGLTSFMDEQGGTGSPVSYLIYLNRSRVDPLRGSFSGLRRSLMGGRLRSGMEKNLRMIKHLLETASIT